jgi:neutral ceramidase
MRAGFGRIDITPGIGIPMGGDMREDVAARGIHDRLYADMIIFEHAGIMLALIDLDWIEASLSVTRKIKQKIAHECQIDYDRICVTMTHTHSGPDTFGYFHEEGISKAVLKYFEDTTDHIIRGILDIFPTMEEVYIGIGRGYEERISFNRRVLLKNGTIRMNWEIFQDETISINDLDRPEGPIDPELYVIKICDAKNKLKGLIVNFALHPAVLVMEDLLFSKDYIWSMEEYLKEKYGDDLFIYFANGSEGNINHINMWDKEKRDAWTEAGRIGSMLGETVKKTADAIEAKPVSCFRVLYRSLDIPVRKISAEEIRNAEEIMKKCGRKIPNQEHGANAEWYAKSLLSIANDKSKTRELEFHVIAIGDSVIATLPGEFFVEFGLDLKKRSPSDKTMLFGIADHSMGYIPTEKALANGGYETVTSEMSILVREAGDIITEKLIEMIKETYCR